MTPTREKIGIHCCLEKQKDEVNVQNVRINCIVDTGFKWMYLRDMHCSIASTMFIFIGARYPHTKKNYIYIYELFCHMFSFTVLRWCGVIHAYYFLETLTSIDCGRMCLFVCLWSHKQMHIDSCLVRGLLLPWLSIWNGSCIIMTLQTTTSVILKK